MAARVKGLLAAVSIYIWGIPLPVFSDVDVAWCGKRMMTKTWALGARKEVHINDVKYEQMEMQNEQLVQPASANTPGTPFRG